MNIDLSNNLKILNVAVWGVQWQRFADQSPASNKSFMETVALIEETKTLMGDISAANKPVMECVDLEEDFTL